VVDAAEVDMVRPVRPHLVVLVAVALALADLVVVAYWGWAAVAGRAVGSR